MSAWVAKRFWKAATVESLAGGFTVHLDGRAVKTPLKASLILPTRPMADAIAQEWDAQQGKINPERMPMTRFANSAIDKVAPQFDTVVEIVAAYGETDLLCYRATGPDGLIRRQDTHWNPMLDWAASRLNAPLVATPGVVYVAQPPATLSALRSRIAALSPFQLAAFHDLVAITGSLILALAVLDGYLPPEQAWTISRIDENWQIEQWGVDEEAAALAISKQTALTEAARFTALCG